MYGSTAARNASGSDGTALMEQDGSLVIEQAEVHGACVQVDATVVLVNAAIESHEVPPVGGW
jgi:hypothetical protein